MSRIAPLEPPYEAEIQSQFDRIMRGAPPLMLFRVMASNPRAWEKFRAGSLLDRGPLTLREREIVIDRTCALTGCEYEWGVHVATFAQAAQLIEEEIRATVHEKATASCWSAAEQALVAAVDALHARATKVEVAILEPLVFVGVDLVFDRERRRLALVEDGRFGPDDLDLAGR